MADVDLPVEHGLTYPPDFLHSLPVLLSRPAPHSPIRQLTAAQFADLQLRSQLSHAPDSVLFPFLHGLEGDNEAQNSFFSTGYTRLPSGRRGRAKVPQFRGLIWVAVEEDDDESEGSDDDDFDDYSSDIDVDVEAEHDQEDTFAMDLDSEPEPSSLPVPESSYMHPIQTRTAAAPPPTSPAKDGAPPPSSASAAPRVPTHERSPTVSSTSSAPPSPTFTTASYATSMSSNPPSPICDADPPLSSECPTPLPMTTATTTTPASSVPRLTSTFKARDLLEVDEHGEARFAHVRVPEGISLRNFGIQVPIYATLSDIVVYSRRGAHRAAFALAEKFKRAIEAKHAERTPVADGELEPVRYNVFVLHASPDDMVRDLGHALTRTDDTDAAHTDGHDAHVDSAPLPANTVNFAQRERDEMRDLTRASEILSVVGADNDQARAGRVYLGNTNDVPFLVQGEPFVPNKDPGYDLCIECHERAPLPNPTHLLGAEEHLAALNAAWARAGEPGERPAPHPSAVMHIAFPSSPSTIGVLLPFVEFLQRVLEPSDGAQAAPWWNRRRSGSSSGSSANGSVPRSTTGRGARVLVWSQDGYTESSVLALALLMVVRGLSLAEAYLDLQVNKKRSFFVYGADLPILRRVDAKLRQPGQQYGHGHGHARTATQTGAIAIQRSPVHTATLAGSLPASYPAGAGGSAQMQGQGQMGMVVRRPRASTSPLLPSLVADHQIWFDDPRFDGSFPSRVLPFLYLGNLNHASNAYMLHALGITHVVSVGECALVPPPELAGASAVCATPPATPEMNPSSNGSTRAELVRSAQGSLWIEEREGRIKVLDIKGVCDDGIDTLEPQLQPVCDWIEKARKEGGQVLVHCRVGVSRSATVTIAYVMQHLGLPLVDAYLIVRSRRLSVLIQPNMRLLYNLCGWEVKLACERAGGDERKLKEELSRTVNWPYLAREVHALNEKYLH